MISLTAKEIALIRANLASEVTQNTAVVPPYEYADTSQYTKTSVTRKPIRYSVLYDSTVTNGGTGVDTTVGTVSKDSLLSDWSVSMTAVLPAVTDITTMRYRLEIIRSGDTIWIQDGMVQPTQYYFDGATALLSPNVECHSNGSNGQLVLLTGDVINLFLQFRSSAGTNAIVRCFAAVNTIPIR